MRSRGQHHRATRGGRRNRRWAVLLLAVLALLAGAIYLASVVGNGTGSTRSSPTPGPSSARPSNPSAHPIETAATAPPRAGTTTISFLTSPVSKGQAETVKGLAAPGSQCTLTIGNQGKPINPPGLKLAMQTDARGEATWAWPIDAGYAPGNYDLKLVCSPGAVSTSSFTVK